MTNTEILSKTNHRPWEMPAGSWKFYQEWNDAIFLHWQVDYELLRDLVPKDIEIDLFEGKSWVSIVAFTMEKIRIKNLPAFPPISNFPEINIRTYVKYKNKTGVYFLSIEAAKKLSAHIAKSLSGMPYRYSKMKRQANTFRSSNNQFQDRFEVQFNIGPALEKKTAQDLWLTERYAVFQDCKKGIYTFEIHHDEWPIHKVEIDKLMVHYPRFKHMIPFEPDLVHFSPGIQVLAWDKIQNK